MPVLRSSGFLLLLVFLAGCLGAGADDRKTGAAASGAAPALTVARGSLRPRLLLTGELAAARAEELVVPRLPTFQVQIRWLVDDGAQVAAGQRLVELDNSEFTSDLEEKRLAAAQAEDELARAAAEAAATAAEKELAIEQKQAELAKARIQSGIPEDLLARRELQERALAVRRAEVALEEARRDLAAHRQASAAELAIQRLELEKTRREIRTAEEAIAALVLSAPRDGIVQVTEHPWEGRKLQEGDSVWTGLPVARIPDLSSMIVEAALSDVDDGRVEPGMAAVCTLDAYPGETFAGRVTEVSPVARESARSSLLRSFLVRLALDRVDLARMRPGMSVKIEVLAPEARGLVAPRAGLDLAAEPPRALLADGGTVPVRLGPCDARACVVLGGLREGARLRALSEAAEAAEEVR